MALISRSEAARLKNVTPQAVYKAINQGRLTPVVDNDGKVMLDKDAFIEDWEKTYHPNQMKKANNYHKPRQKAVVQISLPMKKVVLDRTFKSRVVRDRTQAKRRTAS